MIPHTYRHQRTGRGGEETKARMVLKVNCMFSHSWQAKHVSPVIPVTPYETPQSMVALRGIGLSQRAFLWHAISPVVRIVEVK